MSQTPPIEYESDDVEMESIQQKKTAVNYAPGVASIGKKSELTEMNINNRISRLDKKLKKIKEMKITLTSKLNDSDKQ